MKDIDLVIVGGGPAGLAAAVAAYDAGVTDLLIVEREPRLGGILNQCIHNGFGLQTFGEELTGPEYATRYVAEVEARGIPARLDATVIDVTPDKAVTYVSPQDGLVKLQAKAVILACGCRERPRGALNIAGMRGAGVFSAGTAQKLVNIEGYMPGKQIVVLGSGDIGLIMARRLTFEGATVKAVVELMPYSTGLKRNIVQCLDDYGIPLYLSHTVVRIVGGDRVEGVVVAKVDDNLQPIAESEQFIECDALLLSVGLLPENELAQNARVKLSAATGGACVDENLMTDVSGIFECGNVLHVHDLVDYVSLESALAGRRAAEYIFGKRSPSRQIAVRCGGGVRYCVPAVINTEGESVPCTLRFRVSSVMQNVELALLADGNKLASKRRRIVTPGEMECIELTAEQMDALRHADSVELTVLKGGNL